MIARKLHSLLSPIIIAAVTLLPLLRPAPTRACGPFFTEAIFVYTKHPDMPLERFAGGQLGVLRPTYARSYLVAAYRNLSGNGLSSPESQALKSLWDDRLNYAWEFHDEEWVKKWLEARKKVPGAALPAQIHAFRNREKPHEYETYLNCQQGAFENAERVLDERIQQFGANSSAVRDWLAAQDTVFSNCGGGRQIPEPPQSDADALTRSDRAYQIAAANFYSGALDDARQQFDAIANDRTSPWRSMAAYLAARTLLRKGSFAEKAEESASSMSEAELRLDAILKDNARSSLHPAAARLLNLVRLRLHPEQKLHELAHKIIKRDDSADFKQDVWDYTALLDKFIGEDETESKERTLPSNLKNDDLTDWILSFQDQSTESASHSIDRWQQTKALPWLVAAIAKANAQTSRPIMDAATGINAASPGFATVTYHRVRLLIETGRAEEARQTLDRILTNDRAGLPASALNLLLGQRVILAQSLESLLRYAQQKPAGFSDGSDGRELPEDEKETNTSTNGATLFFNLDVANIFNRAMPVAILREAARSRVLAPNLRKDVATAAFVRAALLNDRESALTVAAVLRDVKPELRELLANYESARTPDAQRFAAIYLMLKFPGLRPYLNPGVGRTTPINEIDSYRDNWWCAESPSLAAGFGEDEDTKKPKTIDAPEFLKPSAFLAAKQYAALQALGTGPNYLCRMAIDWSNITPNDPRVPEALHLAVKSTRYGCTDKQTGRWSKAAFDLLHRRYPNTTWARETKYWFKD